MPYTLVFMLIALLVILLLFLERYRCEKKARIYGMLPVRYEVVPLPNSKAGNPLNSAVIYNINNCSREEALSALSSDPLIRSKCVERELREHMSRKVSNTFSQIQERFSTGTMVSSLYDTALSLGDMGRDLMTNKSDRTSYHIILPKTAKVTAFHDGGNYYLL